MFQNEDEPEPAKRRTFLDSIMEACFFYDWGNEDAILEHILGITRNGANSRVPDNNVGRSQNVVSIKMAGQKA